MCDDRIKFKPGGAVDLLLDPDGMLDARGDIAKDRDPPNASSHLACQVKVVQDTLEALVVGPKFALGTKEMRTCEGKEISEAYLAFDEGGD